MRLFRMSESGRIALVEEPTPAPATGQVLVRVHATSLNARDLFMLDGRYPVPTGRVSLVSTPDWGAEVRKLTDGQGADVVVEVGGGSRSDLET
ncbi:MULTISPECIES: hypothetical protein [unclassified Streptomyces]|uniref:hypothetical protein n=1 Tax=unclassified Streptomyces TaxID=2593676 RepID=UPI00081F6633|nr:MULTISPECIES: hypothetical protein [unclassified Streptomyces]SCF98751.1 hypothetical protein GA0115259_1064211 [Streptomyces sp. MnatMP-M17]